MSECVKYRSLLTGRITTTSIDESKEECIQYANDRSSTLIKEPPMENRMPYNTMIGTRNENNRRHVSSDGNGYLRPRLGGRKGDRKACHPRERSGGREGNYRGSSCREGGRKACYCC